MKWGLIGGFQLMLILGLLGIHFDTAVVFVTKSLLFFRLAVAILWIDATEFMDYSLPPAMSKTYVTS